MATARDYRQRRRSRRDRHGRGLRGTLYPATLPAAASRAERFDALVLDALEPIEARWRHELTKLDVAVDDVPEVRENGHSPADGVLHDGAVPLSRLVPAGVDRSGLPTDRIQVMVVGPSVGPHLGPGCVGAVVIRKG